jgi:glycosyltransferase involved in cell wall biosynthesis
MRILQICSARDLGGGERHVADLATGLVRRGHEVYAAVRPSSPMIGELRSLATEHVFQVGMRGAAGLSAISKIAAILRDNKIEILHAHLAPDYAIAALVSARTATPFILTRHVLFPMKSINRLLLRRAASVIAVSNAVADVMKKQGIFPAEKIVTIHNGVDIERFACEKNRSKRDSLTVGMIGEIAPIKGQTDFVRAAAIVASERSDVHFVMAGQDRSSDGRHRRQLESLIAQLSLSERVRLLGWQDDAARLLRSFDVYVSPSKFDAFGIAIVEAMACRVPVVATASAGAKEIVDDGKTGLLVAVGDERALATAINKLLVDTKLRETFTASAAEAVRDRFSLETMVEATEKVYRSGIAERKVGR